MENINKIEQFLLKHYKIHNMIFPNAIARHCNSSIKETYNELEILKNNGWVKPVYMIGCPYCNLDTGYQYYTILDIEDGMEIGCPHCDKIFTIKRMDNNVKVYYEYIKGDK